MLRIIRLKKRSQMAVGTGSKRNKWDDMNNIGCEASRHFGNKEKEYLKDKINELAMNTKNENIKDLNIGIN
jgi:hypothetical protein